METVLKAIADWIKGILTAGIMSNLSGLFDDVNTQVSNIAQQVGTKPSSFEPRVFAMIEALSRNVVLPIAGIILTFIACYELIEMITQHNNMAQFEPALIMRWIFKTAVSVWLISNTFDIVMAVFDITQKVVSDSSGIIAGNTRVNDIGLSMLQSSMMQMDVGPLFGLFLQSFFIGITMRILSMGGIFCAASFLSITASDISDQLLKDFLDMDSSQIVTMHIQSVDQNRAIKTVKRTITELDRSKIEEQKKAIRAGYDIDIIPSDLATYGRDAKALLKELQSQNERMFLVTFLVLNTGRTEQELENNVFQASSIAQKHNCNLCRLDFQQEQGLMSSLPLADCQIEIQRGLTTSSTAIFIPFTTQELYQSGKESLYYGLNALSNNLIMVDRKKLKNPNGLILGTPGSGKSFSAKREIANAFLVTDDDIIVNDPEGEYSPLVNRLKGQVIKISPNSTQFVNPMDINANYSEEDNPLSLKADFILSLCELVVGGKEGLLPVEKTVIDRCVHLIYRKYFANPCPENMPILEDLYNALLQQDEKEAHHVATALEIYVKGSLNLFNHRTNVNVNNRIVCYDIKELGKQMKKLGMLIVQDQVWGRVTANRSSGKSTRYYMDEMHLLLKEEQTAAYSVEIWKRFRKWGGIPTGLTQNVKDLLSSREVENIFENSDMIIMLNQAAGDRQILAKQLNISPHQLSYVTHSGEGEGLLFFGNVILPFVDRFPTDLELYRIMTTKLGEVSEGAQK